jgi:hypothetical protein
VARKTGSTRGAKKRADVLFSRLIRSRGRCEHCGGTENLQCAHIISRRFSATRVMSENALCLDAKCHHHFTDHPVEFGRWVISYIGEDAYDVILRKAMLPSKVDWAAEVERLKALIPVSDRR